MTSRASLAISALEKSLEVRDRFDYDDFSPLCVYDLAERAGVRVQFIDAAGIDGLYVGSPKPVIFLTSLRPLYRRAFSCAHELGHHFFSHGATLDELVGQPAVGSQPEEFLADTFGGFLLMPTLGLKRAFAVRSCSPATASPEDVYAIACAFGVGYSTLVTHLAHSLRYITRAMADNLLMLRPSQIRRKILGVDVQESLIVVDARDEAATIDAEVGNLLLLPSHMVLDSKHLQMSHRTQEGVVLRADNPGIVHVRGAGEWSVLIRIAPAGYVGLARYRHLEA